MPKTPGASVPPADLDLGQGLEVEIEALEVQDKVRGQLGDLQPLGGGERLGDCMPKHTQR